MAAAVPFKDTQEGIITPSQPLPKLIFLCQPVINLFTILLEKVKYALKTYKVYYYKAQSLPKRSPCDSALC